MAKKRCVKKKISKKDFKKIDKYFLLSWRKVWIIIISWFATVILHNIIFAILGFEEGLFFIIAVIVIPFYSLIVLFYSILKFIYKKIK